MLRTKTTFFLVFLFQMAFADTCVAQKVTDSTFGKPLLWYTVYDPWAMFIGSDGPVLSIYESEKIIYWKDRHYHLAQVPNSELEYIFSELHLQGTLFLKSTHYEASGWT